jgi:hypothetical protein
VVPPVKSNDMKKAMLFLILAVINVTAFAQRIQTWEQSCDFQKGHANYLARKFYTTKIDSMMTIDSLLVYQFVVHPSYRYSEVIHYVTYEYPHVFVNVLIEEVITYTDATDIHIETFNYSNVFYDYVIRIRDEKVPRIMIVSTLKKPE